MQGDENRGETGRKDGAGFSILRKETRGSVCMTGKNDTPGCVDIMACGESEFGRPKKADENLVIELV